jgi:hypothetical protein
LENVEERLLLTP